MATVFCIPSYLRSFTGGQSRIAIQTSTATVGEALAALWAAYPGVRDRIVTEQGLVRPHVNVFVANESIRYTGGLDTPLPDDVEIWIVQAVSGG